MKFILVDSKFINFIRQLTYRRYLRAPLFNATLSLERMTFHQWPGKKSIAFHRLSFTTGEKLLDIFGKRGTILTYLLRLLRQRHAFERTAVPYLLATEIEGQRGCSFFLLALTVCAICLISLSCAFSDFSSFFVCRQQCQTCVQYGWLYWWRWGSDIIISPCVDIWFYHRLRIADGHLSSFSPPYTICYYVYAQLVFIKCVELHVTCIPFHTHRRTLPSFYI